ncbi:hypothetical protein KG089_03680 [Carnobacteriaceae bacterium zg-ZUI252]|nr:hypothetical protein [Carnobacteriaceae bacterium zg-ZUI252]MBS4769580.1 hypothetical protein [Carnobacteriaceae bacterium zg-ZUI240]QTU83045.1 hypothetical protein J7S27_00530 [Carnobacteriaceae bacterium zg-C25]
MTKEFDETVEKTVDNHSDDVEQDTQNDGVETVEDESVETVSNDMETTPNVAEDASPETKELSDDVEAVSVESEEVLDTVEETATEADLGTDETVESMTPENEVAQDEAVVVASESTETSEKEAISTTASDVGVKAKAFLSNKRNVGILAAIIAAIILFFTLTGGPKSVMDKVEVTFEGYDERGRVEYNYATIQHEIDKVILNKVGIDTKNTDLSNWTQFLNNLQSNFDKYQKYEKYRKGVRIRFDKTEGLKNGEEVTLTISADKDSPIKSETKKFKVSGLKDITKITFEDLQKNKPIRFVGFDGNGSVSYDKSVYSVDESLAKTLKNGQKIKVSIRPKYLDTLLESEGKTVENAGQTFEVTASGLSTIKSITNLNELLKQVENLGTATYANKENSSYKYEVEKKNTFINVGYSEYSNDDKASISVVTVYKVKETYTNLFQKEPTVKEYYTYVGYSDLSVSDNVVIMSNLENKAIRYPDKYTDETSVYAFLKSKMYTEYKPGN